MVFYSLLLDNIALYIVCTA